MIARRNENATPQGGVSVVGGQASSAFQSEQQANSTASTNRPAISDQTERDARAIRSRSTSTDSQLSKLIALLRQGPQTTHFLRLHGISHPGGRVNDLRNAGYDIVTHRVRTVDAHGFTHINVARYVLLKEPQQLTFAGQEAA